MSEYAYRLSYSKDGRPLMVSLAALSVEQAASDVERLLRDGAESVEIERVPASSVPDTNDAWNTRRWLASSVGQPE